MIGKSGILGKIPYVDLLVELLISERDVLKRRVLEQRERIVVLTAERDGLLLDRGDAVVSPDAGEVERLSVLVGEKDAELKHLDDALHRANERNVLLEEKNGALLSEVKRLKGDVSTKTTMVDFAKAKGFKFQRIDKMKAFIDGGDDGRSLAEIFSDIESDAKGIGLDLSLPQGTVPSGGGDCPYGMEQSRNKVAVVGGRYCMKKCPYNDGMDVDGKKIMCTKGIL